MEQNQVNLDDIANKIIGDFTRSIHLFTEMVKGDKMQTNNQLKQLQEENKVLKADLDKKREEKNG